MRAKNDSPYKEWKEGALDGFNNLELGWTPEQCTEFLFEQEADNLKGTPVMLFILSIAEYELRHGILEERICNAAAYHIYRYENMRKYRDDLTKDEIEELEKDIAYIKSKVELPVLTSYADRDYQESEKETGTAI